jgi:hypothetical protein
MMANTLAVACNAPPPTPYERHRRRFEETGDEIELDRMLRHIDRT